MEIFLKCCLITITLIVVVGLGTIRTACLVQGRKKTAFVIGFFEASCNVFALSNVVKNFDTTVYAFSYALGFALGAYTGMVIEAIIGVGDQVVRIFTREGKEMADHFREKGITVTEFEGKGKEGSLNMLLIQGKRKKSQEYMKLAEEIDPDYFGIVDDIRFFSSSRMRKGSS
jgi:uncharacterized protein YebE (UPF0316 family)